MTGRTKIQPSGTRTRTGTTPGGRSYSSTRYKDSTGVYKNTDVNSGPTNWSKQTNSAGVSRRRSTGALGTDSAKVYPGAKGPTTPKPSWGKTVTTKSGYKIRTGKTPGGRKYTAGRDGEGFNVVKVGSKSMYTTPAGKSKFDAKHQPIDRGQTKPKGGK